MNWITREHVKVDRVACPWLIKKFVDSDAEFLFVAADKVMETAAREGAIPFDVPGVELGHHEGKSSFEAIVSKYQYEILQREFVVYDALYAYCQRMVIEQPNNKWRSKDYAH